MGRRTLSCPRAKHEGDDDRDRADPNAASLLPRSMTTLSQARSAGPAPLLWHASASCGKTILACGAQDRFRFARFRDSGHGDSAQAAKMAQRLRSILLSDHCLRSRSSRRVQQRRVRQGRTAPSQRRRRAFFSAPVYPWLIVAATKVDDRFAEAVDCSVRGQPQGAGRRRMRGLCATHAPHARRISCPRRARNCACRRAHILEQCGVLARGHSRDACASSRRRSVFIRDDREHHVFALQHRSAGAGIGLEGAAHPQRRACGSACSGCCA